VKADIVTIFPRMFQAYLEDGILARAVASGLIDLQVHDLREFTSDRHRSVDDVPYGGGPGMVLKVEPLFLALDAIRGGRGAPSTVILTSPQGRVFSQAEARRLAALDHLVIVSGRYEGIDERVREHLATEEISIGDYVLSGGELAALVILDACARLIPGAVGGEGSVEADSFTRGLLDFPQFTRPAEFRDWKVPDVLLSGHHEAIRRWRKREALRRTFERRPELLALAELDDEERAMLRELRREKGAE
jgi:tRNA (guanine37-N1)-methyltransferase